jgi:hypothetical protein
MGTEAVAPSTETECRDREVRTQERGRVVLVQYRYRLFSKYFLYNFEYFVRFYAYLL